MRFMMMMIPGGYEKAARGTVPDLKSCEVMMKYNSALQQAGVLLALDGLHPPSMGARVSFAGGKPVVTDGPFAEAKEAIGGYWVIEVKSKEEAIEWAKRCPGSENEVLDIRPMLEIADFPEDVQKALAAGQTELEERMVQQAGA
ncbi:MAG TPA: YciI family protein [Silvibacterium sp.]|nr:YciI family protein [Silvibacterium sp.]